MKLRQVEMKAHWGLALLVIIWTLADGLEAATVRIRAYRATGEVDIRPYHFNAKVAITLGTRVLLTCDLTGLSEVTNDVVRYRWFHSFTGDTQGRYQIRDGDPYYRVVKDTLLVDVTSLDQRGKYYCLVSFSNAPASSDSTAILTVEGNPSPFLYTPTSLLPEHSVLTDKQQATGRNGQQWITCRSGGEGTRAEIWMGSELVVNSSTANSTTIDLGNQHPNGLYHCLSAQSQREYFSLFLRRSVNLAAPTVSGRDTSVWTLTTPDGSRVERYIVEFECRVRNITFVEKYMSVSASGGTGRVATSVSCFGGLGQLYRVKAWAISGPNISLALVCVTNRQCLAEDIPHPTNGSVSVVTLNEAGKVRVTWSAPTMGSGQVITGYSVQYRRRGTPSYTTHSVSGSSTTSYTITNLDLGTVYEVRVASVGPLGLSGYCCGSGKQVTTYNRPKPPTGVTAVPGVNLVSIRVTWVAPLDTGGVPITGYYIQYRIRGSASYSTQLSQPQPTEATIAGLRLGTTYQVRLAVLTTIGIGPYCCTQNGSQVFARTRDVPAKVSWVSAVPGVSSGRPTIRVTWSAPQSDEPIAKYHLQYRKATASSWNAATLAPSETSTVLSGLDRGTVYHVQVRAVSVVGSGPFSDRQQVTTHNVPSFITALSVSPTESAHRPALSVSWYPPQSDLPILHYTVSYSLGDSGAVTNITTTSTHVLIPKLSIGATYQVAVAARSALGEGPRSVWVHQTTFSLPRQVTGVTLSRVVRSGAPALRVTWTAPQSDTAITHYRVRHRKNGMKDWTSRTVSGSPPPTVTYLEGLSLGAAYEVQLQAESAIGPGSFSEVQTATAFDVPASVPEASFAITPTVIGGRSSLSVQWRPPFSDLPILGYTVTVEVSSSVGGRGREVTTTSTSLIVENLAIGTTYTIHLKARSAVGFGAEVQKLANTFDVLPPDEVHSYPLPQRGTVRVTWTVTPNSTHGLTLTGYSVQYREEGGDKYQSQQVTEVPSPGELETFELEGLELGTTYELRVAVVTLSGVGKYSDVINVTTYADCCSECSSIQSAMFVSFEVGSMKVDESDSLVHIDVFRYGPMSDPITLRVTDIPLTAKRVKDYSLQSSSLVFLNTERMVERSTVVVRIREDSIAEQDPPTESFRLVLSSSAAGGGMQPAVVFSVPEMEVHIRDNDY